MENSNESQDQMSTSPTGSARRPVAVENIHVEFTVLPNAAGADQASNDPGDVVAPLGPGVIEDMNCEEDTEIRQQEPQVNGNQLPVCSRPQPSEHENVSLKQPQDGEKVNGCCQRTANKESLLACGLSLANCNCFQRERTINRIDYSAASTSASKQPTTNDDDSGTWENHPLQTFSQHSKLSLTTQIDQIFKSGKKECAFQDSRAKPPMAKVPEEGLFQTTAEEPNEAVTSSSAKPSTSEEESEEESEKEKSLQKQRVCYKTPSREGGGERGYGGGRVDDDKFGENNDGGDGRGSDGEGGSEIMEWDGDPGGGGDDDDCGGGGSKGGSRLPSPYHELFWACMLPLLLPPQSPSFDDGDEEEDFEEEESEESEESEEPEESEESEDSEESEESEDDQDHEEDGHQQRNRG